MEQQIRVGMRDRFYFVVVGGYLSVVMLFLLISGRLDPGVSFRRLVAGSLRRRIKGTMTEFHEEHGHCYVVQIPSGPISDAEGRSRIRLFEDGQEIGPGHCSHDDVRQVGEGRFSHWQNYVYFSTPDNSDPRSNDRTYTYSE